MSVCKCHGEPMYWKRDKGRKNGGRFICHIKKREWARASVARKGVANADTVPTLLVLPIVKDYLSHYETDSLNSSDPRYALSPITILADEAGIGERRLRGWVNGERMTAKVPFNFADSLLCAMGKHESWYSEPLADVYWNVSLPEIARERTSTHVA